MGNKEEVFDKELKQEFGRGVGGFSTFWSLRQSSSFPPITVLRCFIEGLLLRFGKKEKQTRRLLMILDL